MQLCNKLGPESLELIHMFESGVGDRRVEAAMQSLFPPVEYDLWDATPLEAILEMLWLSTRRALSEITG